MINILEQESVQEEESIAVLSPNERVLQGKKQDVFPHCDTETKRHARIKGTK